MSLLSALISPHPAIQYPSPHDAPVLLTTAPQQVRPLGELMLPDRHDDARAIARAAERKGCTPAHQLLPVVRTCAQEAGPVVLRFELHREGVAGEPCVAASIRFF